MCLAKDQREGAPIYTWEYRRHWLVWELSPLLTYLWGIIADICPGPEGGAWARGQLSSNNSKSCHGLIIFYHSYYCEISNWSLITVPVQVCATGGNLPGNNIFNPWLLPQQLWYKYINTIATSFFITKKFDVILKFHSSGELLMIRLVMVKEKKFFYQIWLLA